MDRNQHELCVEVLRRLEKEGVLKRVLLVGSWCMVAYLDYFKGTSYRPAVRTRDIDLLVPIPPCFEKKISIQQVLSDLDFITDYSGNQGFVRFVHEDLMLEFLVPERGRGSSAPIPYLRSEPMLSPCGTWTFYFKNR